MFNIYERKKRLKYIFHNNKSSNPGNNDAYFPECSVTPVLSHCKMIKIIIVSPHSLSVCSAFRDSFSIFANSSIYPRGICQGKQSCGLSSMECQESSVSSSLHSFVKYPVPMYPSQYFISSPVSDCLPPLSYSSSSLLSPCGKGSFA